MRLSDGLMGGVDEWRRLQPDLPGRSEAIRRLLTHALENPPGSSSRNRLARGD